MSEDRIIVVYAGINDIDQHGNQTITRYVNPEIMSKITIEQKDEYPCMGCGDMVDVEEFCENNGECKNCFKESNYDEEE